MHRLPQYFADPEEFRPERFPPEFEAQLPRFAYLPFGGGPRVCIGNAFAMMEAQLVLAMPAQRFAFHLAPTAKVATQPLITLMTKDGMPLRVAARQPQPRVAPVDGAASPMVATRALALAA